MIDIGRATVTSLHVTNAWHPSSGGIRTFYTALMDGTRLAWERATARYFALHDELLAQVRRSVTPTGVPVAGLT